MDSKDWIKFKKEYSKLFRVEERIVDYIAMSDILLYCVSGRGTGTIGRYLDMDVDYIENSLYDFIKFKGFEYDLDLNPLSIYDRVGDFDSFVSEIKLISPVSLDNEIVLWYNICGKYAKIREELREFYDRTS